MGNIQISFLERKFALEDNTGMTIKGYELARITLGKEERIGRVIDVKKMNESNYSDTVLFQTIIPLENSEVDMTSFLQKNEGGIKWLENHKRYFLDTFNKKVPMNLSIKSADFPAESVYTLYSKNINDRNCPRGVIGFLPKRLIYSKILPPMKFDDRKWIPNIYYSRKVKDEIFNSYSIQILDDFIGGVLLGELNQEDIKKIEGNFDNCFPLHHFLEVSYPVALRQIPEYNPLTIRIEKTE